VILLICMVIVLTLIDSLQEAFPDCEISYRLDDRYLAVTINNGLRFVKVIPLSGLDSLDVDYLISEFRSSMGGE
jgi:hypothetical protein